MPHAAAKIRPLIKKSLASGRSRWHIASVLGVTRRRIYQICPVGRKLHRLTPAEIREIRRQVARGYSRREVAEVLGYARHTVNRYASKLQK